MLAAEDLEMSEDLEKALLEARGAGDDLRALMVLAELMALEPESGRWAYNRGVHLQALGRPAEAEAAYQQAVELRPEHAWSWTNLGRLLDDRCAWPEALEAYTRALALPEGAKDEMTWTNLGNTLMSLGRFEDALERFEKAIELGDDGPALLGRNTVLGWMGRVEEANACRALGTRWDRGELVEAGPAGCDSDKCLLPLAKPGNN